MDIFEVEDHFQYLRTRFDPRNSNRGIKTKFADAIRIQPAFLSQVLAEKYSLNLEQADLANQFFDHSTEESHFFILLVSRDRAGTSSLKNYYQIKIDEALKKRELLYERLGHKVEIGDQVKATYYSSWIYAAIHVACTIPSLRTRHDLAQHFNLPIDVVGQALDFLAENQILTKADGTYVTTNNWIRLDRKSPQIIKHHTNWRLKAIQDLEIQKDDDLHYSGIFSMDEETAKKIKSELLDFLKLQLKSIEVSTEEELIVWGIDFFRPVKK